MCMVMAFGISVAYMVYMRYVHNRWYVYYMWQVTYVCLHVCEIQYLLPMCIMYVVWHVVDVRAVCVLFVLVVWYI